MHAIRISRFSAVKIFVLAYITVFYDTNVIKTKTIDWFLLSNVKMTDKVSPSASRDYVAVCHPWADFIRIVNLNLTLAEITTDYVFEDTQAFIFNMIYYLS